MHYNINKETIKAIMEDPGEVCGSVLKKDENFILKKGGRKKIEAIENELSEMGFPFSYKKIKEKDFYPWGKRILSLLSVSMVFNLDKKGMEEFGAFSAKKSKVKSFLIRYFSSPKMELKKFVKEWRKCNTVGRVETKKKDNKKRQVVVCLYNLNLHPVFCDYFCGYLKQTAATALGKNVECREVKCYFKGESFHHEFLLSW